MSKFGKTDVRRIIVLAMLLLWCAGMVAVRMERTGSGYYRFLLANLFLAAIPLFLSTCLRVADRLRFHWTIMSGLFGLWLLFLPMLLIY